MSDDTTLIDVDALLAPISPEAPAGSDPRYSATTDRIRGMRREADAEGGPGAVTKWALLADAASEALRTEAKDLQFTIWLIEALCRVEGFRGARDGFVLVRRLVDQYWDGLFPAVDPDDPEPLSYRVSTVHWLDERLPQILKNVPIVGPPAAYTLLHYDATQKIGDQRKALTEDGWPTADQFEGAMANSPMAFLEARLTDLSSCLASLAELEQVFDARFVERKTTASGAERLEPLVSVRNLKETLTNCHWLVERAFRARQPAPGAGAPGPGGSAPMLAGATGDEASDAARAAVRTGQLVGLQALQQGVSAAQSGRERFLRLLEFAEVALEAGLQSLAHPVYEELARIAETRALEDWEHRATLARVWHGLAECCRRLAPLQPALAERQREAEERVARLQGSSGGGT